MLLQLVAYRRCCCDIVAACDCACCVACRYGGQKVSQRDIQRLVRFMLPLPLLTLPVRAAVAAATACAMCPVAVLHCLFRRQSAVHVYVRQHLAVWRLSCCRD
jgi:2-methylaconitate cis-trans-isomerase PrpF